MCDSCWNAAYITARLTGKHQADRWQVRRLRGKWAVYSPGSDTAHEDWPTLSEAMTAARQLSIVTELFKPGGVTAFKQLRQDAETWARLSG